MRLERGQRYGDFELIAPIGRGGMGQVWEARQVGVERLAALKFLLVEANDSDLLAQFAKEARAAGRLTHPGIVGIYTYSNEPPTPWIAMELVENGMTLDQLLSTVRAQEELADGAYERFVASLIASTAEAVAYAHEQGVIHRDLKPQNILIDTKDQVRVTDFGLARIEDESSLSRTGEISGSCYYMSPEQSSGLNRQTTHQTDVFSLGVVLYEALTLEKPFVGETSQQIMRRIVFEEAPPMSRGGRPIAKDLRVICLRALEKAPSHRLADMTLFAAELRRFCAGETIQSRPTGWPVRLGKWARRHPILAATGLVTLLALTVITSLLFQVLAQRDDIQAKATAVMQLSSFQDLDLLERKADEELWTPEPDLDLRLTGWLSQAQEQIEKLGQLDDEGYRGHQATLESLRANATKIATDEGESWELMDEYDQWWHDRLTELVTRLEELSDPESGLIGGTSSAHGWGVERRSAEHGKKQAALQSPLWNQAIQEVSETEIYRGQSLTPQYGLLPLGADPETGLQEFAVIGTGPAPSRGPEGRLELTDDFAIVLVLLPKGDAVLGTQTEDPTGPNHAPADLVDSMPLGHHGPVETVGLEPFFLSKYEMTVSQWSALTGARPNAYHGDLDRHPVEQVDRDQCLLQLNRHGLTIPTEAQWEFAARGKEAGLWPTGVTSAGLDRFGNLADSSLVGAAPSTWELDRSLNDGHAVHAPVGQFQANAYGLHDVIGNLWEWTRDYYIPLGVVPERAIDGSVEMAPKPGDGLPYVLRGGSWATVPRGAQFITRYRVSSDFKRFDHGVRPARQLQP